MGVLSAAHGEIVGEIVRVGYPVTANDAIRAGAWTPVVVDLTLRNRAAFSGELRLRQFDRDGDVYIDSVPVNLFAESGGRKSYWLYTIANPVGGRGRGFVVELLAKRDDDDPGRIVGMVSGGTPVRALTPAVDPLLIPHDDYLILTVSSEVIGRIDHLRKPDQAEAFARRPHVAHVAPGSLPNHWFGLEMVDCVVWDEADATVLTDAQSRALVDWVAGGGKLLIAAARTAGTLAQSKFFGPLLPVEVGAVETVAELDPDQWKPLGFQGGPVYANSQRYGISVARCKLRDHRDVKDVLTDRKLGSTVIASRRFERGRLIFAAATLGDLLSGRPPEGGEFDAGHLATNFFKRVLELRQNPFHAEQPQDVSLFRCFDRETAFLERAGASLALAMLFAVTYVLLATLGVWKLLQSRGMLKYSWTAFAVVAIAASLASIAGVQASRGVGRKLHQLTVIDAVAGEIAAQGSAYFGLVSPIYSDVDVWLPQDALLDTGPQATPCFLRPMLDLQDWIETGTGYTDSRAYRLLPATAEIHRVPLRATLKQFEGRWSDSLRGTIGASLGVATRKMPGRRGEGQERDELVLTPDSWIENALGVDLEDCYLFWASNDSFWSGNFYEAAPRAQGDYVTVCPLERIEAGERVDLFDRLYRDPLGARLSEDKRKDKSLKRFQNSWGKSLGAAVSFGAVAPRDEYDLASWQNAVLLLTVLSDYDPVSFGLTTWGVMTRFSRGRVRHLDMSDLLTARSAILVGFSEEPGPIRLGTRTGDGGYEAADPDRALTAYRFVIPMSPGS